MSAASSVIGHKRTCRYCKSVQNRITSKSVIQLCQRTHPSRASSREHWCRDAGSTSQIILSFEPRSDLLDQFTAIDVVFWSFLHHLHLPTVGVRLNRNREI